MIGTDNINNGSIVTPSISDTPESISKATDAVSTVTKKTLLSQLQTLGTATKKHRIYVKTGKGKGKGEIVAVHLDSNWFLKFLKIILLINFFKHTIRGHSSNDQKVFRVINEMIVDLDNLKLCQTEDTYLKSTIKGAACALEVLRAKNSKNAFRNAAFKSLKEKIHDISSKVLPSQPEDKSKVSSKPVGSEKGVQDSKPVKKRELPSVDDYSLPEIYVNEAAIREKVLQVQSKCVKRKDSLDNLEKALQDYQQNESSFSSVEEKLDNRSRSLVVKDEPVKEAQTSSPPPPPPPPPTAASAKTSRKQKQEALLKQDVKPSEESIWLCDYIKTKSILDNAYKTIFEVLFPNQEMFDVDMKTLEPYIKKFRSDAAAEIKSFEKYLVENNPLKTTLYIRGNEPLKTSEYEGLPRNVFNEIQNIRNTLSGLISLKKEREEKQTKLETTILNNKREVVRLNELAKTYIPNKYSNLSCNEKEEYLKLFESIAKPFNAKDFQDKIDLLAKNIETKISTLKEQANLNETEDVALIAAANKLIQDLLVNTPRTESNEKHNVSGTLEEQMENIKHSLPPAPDIENSPVNDDEWDDD